LRSFFGLVSELKKERKRFGDRVVFMHTGGAFGLFSEPERFASVLS
jgi:D-cysteine desulfhydrase